MSRKCFRITTLLTLAIIQAWLPANANNDQLDLGYGALAKEHTTKALSIFRGQTAKDPDNSKAWVGLCATYLQMESPNQAMDAIKRAFQLEPDSKNSEFYRTRARVYILQRRFKDALKDTNKAIQLAGLNGDNLRLRAIYNANSQNFKGGLADCISAIKVDPKNPDNYDIKCDIDLMVQDPKQMLADAQQQMKLAPNAGRSFRTRGRAYMHLSHYKLAMSDFKKSLEINSEDAKAMILHGTCLLDTKRPDAAITEFKRAAKVAPWYWMSHAAIANALSKSIDATEALPYATKAIELNPYQPYSLFVRGELYRDTNELEKALADFSKCVELGVPVALCTKGELLSNLNQYDKAVEAFTAAIAQLPEAMRPYRQRATAYEHLKRLKEAESDFALSVKYQPTSTAIHEHRGMFFYRNGKYQKAIEEFSFVIERDPKTVRSRQYRAMCYEKLNKMDLAYKDKAELNTLEDVFHGFDKMSGQFSKAKKQLGGVK